MPPEVSALARRHRRVMVAIVALVAGICALRLLCWRLDHAVLWQPVGTNSLRSRLQHGLLETCETFRRKSGGPRASEALRIAEALIRVHPADQGYYEMARPKFAFTISEVVDLLGCPDTARRKAARVMSVLSGAPLDLVIYNCGPRFPGGPNEKLIFFPDSSTRVVRYVSLGQFRAIR